MKISKFLPIVFICGNLFAGAFEKIGMGARPKGMGESFSAVADDINSAYWNPAGLSAVKEPVLNVSYSDLYSLGLINYSYFSYAHPKIGRGTVGFSWLRMGTNLSFLRYKEDTFVFSYAINLLKNYSQGINIKYYSADYGYGKAEGSGIDLALKYEPLDDKLKLAFVLSDIGDSTIYWQTKTRSKIESNFVLGAAFAPDNTLIFSADIEKNSTLKIGIEKWFFYNTIALRLGTLNPNNRSPNFTAGFGITFGDAGFDYAYELHSELGNNHMFSFKVGI